MNQFGNNALFNPTNIFVIPDIHADYLKLEALIRKLLTKIKTTDHVVFLGDIFGNHGNNFKTLQLIQDLKNKHPNTFVIRGNHEENLFKYLTTIHGVRLLDYAIISEYLELIQSTELVKKHLLEYLQKTFPFLNEMIPYYETEEAILTHAPLIPTFFSLHGTDQGVLDTYIFDLQWQFIDKSDEQRKINHLDKWSICGHQNNNKQRLIPTVHHDVKKVFLDTGVGYNPDATLFCFNFNQKDYFFY